MWYDTLRFTIHTPELAMVRFVVEDYDKTSKNDFVGQYTLPLSCVQQGEPAFASMHALSNDWLILLTFPLKYILPPCKEESESEI